jgi:hypothetical protein
LVSGMLCQVSSLKCRPITSTAASSVLALAIAPAVWFRSWRLCCTCLGWLMTASHVMLPARQQLLATCCRTCKAWTPPTLSSQATWSVQVRKCCCVVVFDSKHMQMLQLRAMCTCKCTASTHPTLSLQETWSVQVRSFCLLTCLRPGICMFCNNWQRCHTRTAWTLHAQLSQAAWSVQMRSEVDMTTTTVCLLTAWQRGAMDPSPLCTA